MLTWSLVVCTLNRREILLKCLEATLKQSRKPQQMIIVDASDDWQESKKLITNSLGGTLLEPEFIYSNPKSFVNFLLPPQGIGEGWGGVKNLRLL